MGGKPNKGTPADRRLGQNKPSITSKPDAAIKPKPGNCK